MREALARPSDTRQGPLTAEGLCLYHADLLPAACTLVGRTGCVGCLLSRRNLDAGPRLPAYPDRRDRPAWAVEVPRLG